MLKRILAWLHRKCRHPSNLVVADLLEGGGPHEIQWCRVCGAVRKGENWPWDLAVDPWGPGPTTAAGPDCWRSEAGHPVAVRRLVRVWVADPRDADTPESRQYEAMHNVGPEEAQAATRA